jgi:PIN domain nuclease of toxin-antitoxin system
MSEKWIVVDSSAYLALVHQETGYRQVAEYLESMRGIMSAVNAAEVLSKQADIGVPLADALALMHLTGVVTASFGPEEALSAASLRKAAKPLGLSLGDRACLALGLKYQCPVLTADRIWQKLEIGVKVLCVR